MWALYVPEFCDNDDYCCFFNIKNSAILKYVTIFGIFRRGEKRSFANNFVNFGNLQMTFFDNTDSGKESEVISTGCDAKLY
jgi:hypothetical protein